MSPFLNGSLENTSTVQKDRRSLFANSQSKISQISNIVSKLRNDEFLNEGPCNFFMQIELCIRSLGYLNIIVQQALHLRLYSSSYIFIMLNHCRFSRVLKKDYSKIKSLLKPSEASISSFFSRVAPIFQCFHLYPFSM